MITLVINKHLFYIPIKDEIIEKIKSNGGTLYLVGGACRNIFLNIPPYDYDFVVENIPKENFIKLFPEAEIVGKHFGVFLINGMEFALTRQEWLMKKAKDRKDFHIKHGISIEEDLKRRDFTVNAIAINIHNNKLIDPYNGQKDIKNKILKAFSKAFKEDPLRILRGARLAAQYNMTVDNNTIKMIKEMKDSLKSLSKERVLKEFEKVLHSNYPKKFFEVLIKAEIADIWFPEIEALYGIPQDKENHPEGDVLTHSCMVLKAMQKYSHKESLLFAALTHDLGKGLTPYQEWPAHYGHDYKGIKPLIALCNRLKVPNKWEKVALLGVKEHMRARIHWKEMKPGKLVKLFEKIKRSPLNILEFCLILISDNEGRGVFKKINMNIFKSLYYKMFSETNGNMVKGKGPEIGERLFQLRCHWLKNRRKNLLSKKE